MAYGSPVDPVSGTIITVAYCVTNLLTPIRALRALTGNADPPAEDYVVVSTPTGSVWKKIPATALATGAVVASLGYTPVNKAGDTGIGSLASTTGTYSAKGIVAGSDGVNGGSGGFNTTGPYQGGDKTLGADMAVIGINVGADGIASDGPIQTDSNVDALNGIFAGTVEAVDGDFSGDVGAAGTVEAGAFKGGSTSGTSVSFFGIATGNGGANIGSGGIVNNGPYTGGSTTLGVPSFLGIVTGASGATIGSGGIVNNGPYTGGSTTLGVPSFLGINVGGSGIGISGQINSSVATGTPPFVVASTTEVANLNASRVAGKIPTATPTANALPLANASGLLDNWVTASAGIPSGLGAWVPTAAAIPSGWSRYTNLDGRVPVGAGTTFSVTFTENTNYGSSWAHKHTSNSFTVSATGSAVGGPSDNTGNASNRQASKNVTSGAGSEDYIPDHSHSLNGVSLAVSASGTASGDTSDASWVIPSRAVVWITKN